MLQRFLVDVFSNILGLIVLRQYADKPDCGIPVVEWCQAIFWWNIFYSTSQLNLLWLVKYGTSCTLCFLLSSFLIYFLSGLSWTIYGLRLYFSKENQCPNDLPMAFMIFSLIGGSVLVIFIVAMAFAIPCLVYHTRQMMIHQSHSRNEMNEEIISRLKKAFYDPERFQAFQSCTICMIDFDQKDMVTQLSCDVRHYFHTDCLIKWIKQGKAECPFCRQAIDPGIRQLMSDDLENQNHFL